jgi:hypothetical protein
VQTAAKGDSKDLPHTKEKVLADEAIGLKLSV